MEILESTPHIKSDQSQARSWLDCSFALHRLQLRSDKYDDINVITVNSIDAYLIRGMGKQESHSLQALKIKFVSN